MSTHRSEVARGERFEFGKNWQAFLSTLNDERIRRAEESLAKTLRVSDLQGKSMIDIGSGSGLFSLAARNLGARVHSFDYDPQSVACTNELRDRFHPNDPDWVVEEGSVLDTEYLHSLGTFDLVYSWGVLHHTGDMWQALENVAPMVKPGGQLYIALYNDQGAKSKFWRRVKQTYCSGLLGRILVTTVFVPYFFIMTVLLCLVLRRNVFREHRKSRGMSSYYDWFDWFGGLPFEVAKAEEVFHFFTDRGFRLENMTTTNSLGNNQWVFRR